MDAKKVGTNSGIKNTNNIEGDLSRIEAILSQHPLVRETAVIMQVDVLGAKKLVAYIVPSQNFPSTETSRQLMRIEEGGTLTPLQYYLLPNGFIIAHESVIQTNILFPEIFESNIYLRHGITLTDGDCIFDVGANVGLFSLSLHQKHKNISIYAFEPGPPTFRLLCINAMLHEMHMKAFEYGISRQNGISSLKYFPQMSGMSSFFWQARPLSNSNSAHSTAPNSQVDEVKRLWREILKSSEIYDCQVKTISQIIREQSLECVNLLKIDVEKSEFDVLAGIQEEDWRKIKQIVVEVHNRYLLDQIITLLEKQNYKIVVEVEGGQESKGDLILPDDPYKNGQYLVYAIQRLQDDNRVKGQQKTLYVPLEKPYISNDKLYSLLQPVVSKYVSPEDLCHFLYQKLPNPGIPIDFVLIKQLPTNSKGEVDRRLLSLLSTSS